MQLAPAKRAAIGTIGLITRLALPFAIIVALIAFTAAYYGAATASTQTDEFIDVFCTPDGKAHVRTMFEAHHYNQYWDPALVLTVTLGFGNLNYGAARAIDVCWDLVVGRGGQVLLALVTYPVLRRSLRLYMETTSVHFDLYATLAFDKVSFAALWPTLRDAIVRQQSRPHLELRLSSLRSYRLCWNWRYFAHALVLTYVLAFPTLASIMTGYQARYKALVAHPDNDFLMEIEALRVPALILIDGSRMGYQDYQPIFEDDPDFWVLLSCKSLSFYLDTRLTHAIDMGTVKWKPSIYPDGFPSPGNSLPCRVASSVIASNYSTGTCSFTVNGPWNVSSLIDVNGRTWSLTEKPLDIWSQSRYWLQYGQSDPWYMAYENLTFNSVYLQQNGICQPTDHYQWGFSSILLLVFCVCTALFAIILTSLHYDAFWNSRTDRYQYDVNHYRDAVDLVRELDKKHLGPLLRGMSAKVLKKQIEVKNIGASLDTSDLHPRATRKEEFGRYMRSIGGGAAASMMQICNALNITYPRRK